MPVHRAGARKDQSDSGTSVFRAAAVSAVTATLIDASIRSALAREFAATSGATRVGIRVTPITALPVGYALELAVDFGCRTVWEVRYGTNDSLICLFIGTQLTLGERQSPGNPDE